MLQGAAPRQRPLTVPRAARRVRRIAAPDAAPLAPRPAPRAPQRPAFGEALARKLSLAGVLHGHAGCVNRLAWNEDGSMLASASDDLRVRLKLFSSIFLLL